MLCDCSGSFATNTTFGVMRSITQAESVWGLWRGITPTLIGVMPARAMYFGAYSNIKRTLADHGLQGHLYNFASAAGAGSISATLCCPIWVVKTRLQLAPAHAGVALARQNVLSLGFANASNATMTVKAAPQFSSVRQVAMDMYRKEGPRAFFRGLTASYWGITESAVQFALYEESKTMIEEPTNFKYFLTAGACKLVASALTYPHEVCGLSMLDISAAVTDVVAVQVVRTRMRDQRAPLGSKDLKYVSYYLLADGANCGCNNSVAMCCG